MRPKSQLFPSGVGGVQNRPKMCVNAGLCHDVNKGEMLYIMRSTVRQIHSGDPRCLNISVIVAVRSLSYTM